MSTIHITVSVYNNRPDQERLARADRYEQRASQSIDRRERRALLGEADRIHREEGL